MVLSLFSIKGKAPACVRDLQRELALGGACEEAAREFRLRADLLPAPCTPSNQSQPSCRAPREGCWGLSCGEQGSSLDSSLISSGPFSWPSVCQPYDGHRRPPYGSDRKSLAPGNKQSQTHGTHPSSLDEEQTLVTLTWEGKAGELFCSLCRPGWP